MVSGIAKSLYQILVSSYQCDAVLSFSPFARASMYNDRMRFQQTTSPVLANTLIAKNTYLIRLCCEALAAAIRPGQFVMIRLTPGSDPLLGRPFALYDTVLDESGRPIGIDVVFLVVGKMTARLANLKPGDSVEIWGPLGNGFPEPLGDQHVGLVAGGIGQTPFLAHIRELLGTRGYAGQQQRRRVQKVSLYYGVRSADLAAGVEDFRQAGATLHLASNDGSLGHRGFVTDLLASHDAPQHLFGCGPEPMLHALALQAERRVIPCHLSLETPMACGVGICFSCVTPVKTEGGWDYKRVCVEGPVFDAACLHWS
jgi:dihydroorotate dehydrogenase electron transfer subunit